VFEAPLYRKIYFGKLDVSTIRFILLFFCVIGATHAKADHIPDLHQARLSPVLVSLSQNITSTCQITALDVSAVPCLSNTASTDSLNQHSLNPHSSKLASSTDFSNDIYVNSFNLRFAHGSFNHDELTPDYVEIFEFSVVSFSSTAWHYTERFTPQHDWMILTKSKSPRISSWKDSNLQYIPQQYPHLFA
ncbi:MAG: hypothetical protein ACTJHE_15795, partial [Vibrio casei]